MQKARNSKRVVVIFQQGFLDFQSVEGFIKSLTLGFGENGKVVF